MSHAADEPADLKAQLERLRQLYHVSNVIHASLDPQEALQLILREAIQLTRATSGSAILINPTTRMLEIQAAHGLPKDAMEVKLRVGEGITGHVALTGKPARVGNVRADPHYVEVSREINSELAVPLEVQGELRGVLNVDSTELNAFSESDQELLQELAIHASNVIRNTWLYEQVRLKARLLETLVSIGQTISSTLNLDETLGVITREACSLMAGKVSSLLLLDDSRQWLDLRAHFGAGEAYVQKPRLSVEDSVVGVVVRRKKPLQVDDVQNSARYQNVSVAQSEGLISLISVPLLFRGEVIGVLNVYTGQPYSFSNEEVRILSALADLSAIAIEKARLYERIVDVEEHLRQNEKLSALGLLAAEVAHEIRNPLTVMKMLYHSMDLKFAPDDPRAKDAEIMGQKMNLMNRIVEKILDFARHSEPHLQPVNLNKLIDDLGLLTRHKLRNQNIQLEKDLDPALPQVMADPTQLEQAFLNLTLNAVEAMSNGGKLRIATRKNDSSVEVEFQDSGEGMTPDQTQHAFTSLLNTTKAKGVGLGLAIVGRVVEAHRGQTSIQSTKGQGTTITLSFPVQ
ncbi:MAG TPA: GAF domain-containing protein [Verrucomicrobiae bacterium]|nr:GAF domain-containing protein [Verrucomicrobiae bacterium]